jgi:two-component system phosphate regulon sensor histidine kinase PhoR
LALLSFAGMILTQVLWVKKSYENQEREFNENAHLALNCAIDEIQSINRDSSYIHSPVKQIASHSFVVQMNDTVHPYLLENILVTEFERYNVSSEFDYGIYDCFIDDSIVYGGRVSQDTSINFVSEEIHGIKWDKDGHYFGVYFPKKNHDILSVTKQWAFSTFLLLIFILFLSYALFVILKQKRMSEVKTDFINNMTHEFKTPISSISLSSEVLLNDDISKDPKRIKQYAEIIYNENQRLKRQVEKVLQIASLDKEELQLKSVDINLHTLIVDCTKSLNVLLLEKDGVLDMNLDATNPNLEGDLVHITNIVYNLIDNAIKYAGDNPKVQITTSNSGKNILLKIKDNGIGIAPEHQKMIFDKFYRVPTGNVHDVKGFGLGLYYVKKILVAHHGAVQVISKEGKGSEFIIKIPSKTS